MKKSLIICFCLCSYFWAAAQQNTNVLDWQSSTSLYRYTMLQLHSEFDARKAKLDKALQSRASMLAYRDSCLKRYKALLGKMPPKTALKATITGTIKCDGYTIKKVIYQSWPDHHVNADLYIPDGKGPFPGILFFCGHEMTSKATESYQKTAILLAKHHYVVLSIDPISQGERLQLTDKNGKRATGRGSTTGHTLLNAGANLVGTSVVAYQLWDNERGLDYLSSLPEVDTSRLGCLGNSGGGTQAAYFMAFDPRIKVASSCSYMSRRTRRIEAIGPQDGCQWMPDEGKAQLDISDCMIMFAPKPALILAGRYDFVDYYGTEEVYRELQNVYQTLGVPQKIDLFTYDDGHGISKPKREAVTEWFDRWFYQDTTKVVEGDLPILTEKQLNCTSTGQVNTAFAHESDVQDMNFALGKKEASARKAFLQSHSKQEILAQLKKLLGLQKDDHQVEAEQMGEVQFPDYSFNKMILRRSGQVPLPVLIAYPKGAVRNVVIWLDENGKQEIADSSSLIKNYLENGTAVVAADVRGTGETKDPKAYNSSKYFNTEYRDEVIALLSGHPLPGQQVEDVFTLLDYLNVNPQLQQKQITINANGPLAAVALYAKVLDQRILEIKAYNSINSFMDILEHPLMKEQYAYVVPDILEYFDLPDLLQLAK